MPEGMLLPRAQLCAYEIRLCQGKQYSNVKRTLLCTLGMSSSSISIQAGSQTHAGYAIATVLC